MPRLPAAAISSAAAVCRAARCSRWRILIDLGALSMCHNLTVCRGWLCVGCGEASLARSRNVAHPVPLPLYGLPGL